MVGIGRGVRAELFDTSSVDVLTIRAETIPAGWVAWLLLEVVRPENVLEQNLGIGELRFFHLAGQNEPTNSLQCILASGFESSWGPWLINSVNLEQFSSNWQRLDASIDDTVHFLTFALFGDLWVWLEVLGQWGGWVLDFFTVLSVPRNIRKTDHNWVSVITREFFE